MTSIKSTADIPLDEIDRLDIVLRKYLPMLKAKKCSMIASSLERHCRLPGKSRILKSVILPLCKARKSLRVIWLTV